MSRPGEREVDQDLRQEELGQSEVNAHSASVDLKILSEQEIQLDLKKRKWRLGIAITVPLRKSTPELFQLQHQKLSCPRMGAHENWELPEMDR